MMNQSLNTLCLETFPAINRALCLARVRVGPLDEGETELALINEKEVWAAFAQLPEQDVCDDAFAICRSPESAAVFDVMFDVDFCPMDTRHFALGVCLFAALLLRSDV